MWWYKDLTSGDTTQYFLDGVRWFETWHAWVLWSPMYTTFYGSLMHFTTDPYAVTILHRLVIVFVSAVLVLALMRRLLPPGIAWMAAAWWVILPINFNALYEVHLFVVIPLLLGVLTTLWIPGVRGRGMCAGILLLTGTLMRNEYLVAAALFTVLSMGWELFRSPPEASRFQKLGLAFGLPSLAALVLTFVFFVRSRPAFSSGMLRAKQTLNVCQVFAATGDISKGLPTFKEVSGPSVANSLEPLFRICESHFHGGFPAESASPAASTCCGILNSPPAGCRVLLFNFRSGPAKPGLRPDLSIHPGLDTHCAGLHGARRGSGPMGSRTQTPWRAEWTEQQVWAWIALGCMAVSVCAALLSNRPKALLHVYPRHRFARCDCLLLLRDSQPLAEFAESGGGSFHRTGNGPCSKAKCLSGGTAVSTNP